MPHSSPLAAASLVADVDAGPLRAQVTLDPWRLVFAARDGQPVLAEATDNGPGPAGPIGFRTAAGWVHATRVASHRRHGDRLELVLETSDTAGRWLSVHIEPAGDGIVAVEAAIAGGATNDVEALGAGWAASAGERFFGLGERANAVEHRGETVESYVSDGPYREDEWPILAQLLPHPGFRLRADATYFPIPWTLSSRGYGVLVTNDEVVYHRLGSERPDAWSFEVAGAPDGEPMRPVPPRLRFEVFAGPRPADALRRYTARAGRQPALAEAAPWVFGPWFQPGGSLESQLGQLEKLRAADAPLSVAQTYLHYLPCGGNRAREPERTDAFHRLGLAVTTYFNPMLCQSYTAPFRRAAASDALMLTADGSPYLYDYFTSRRFTVGQFDFTAAAGRLAFRYLLSDAVADGYDGWMEDFGEYTPLDAFTHDGLSGAAGHNRYATDYHCAAYDFARKQNKPVIRFQRSGWTGAARCAQVVWGGDPTTDWGFDGLESVVLEGLGMGLSGVSAWGSDIGGFFSFLGRRLTSEMLVRWVQLGAFSGVMRTERDGIAVPEVVRPQVEDDDQIVNWRRYAKLRTQLHPYIAAAAAEYQRSGLPIMRHLILAHPDDEAAIGRSDEYLFGPDLLVAPVLVPGATEREAYLPAGEWIDLWRSVRFIESDGSLALEAAEVLPGGRAVTVPAPLEEIPVFVRAGALLPLLPADVDTLADFGRPEAGVVRLADRRGQLEMLAFPRGAAEAQIGRLGRAISTETAAGWQLDLQAPGLTRWRLQASLATLERPITPCAVEWSGRALPRSAWSFDAAHATLRARFAGTSGRLVVRSSCARG